MADHYEPLHVPEAPSRKPGLLLRLMAVIGIGPLPTLRALNKQLKARPKIDLAVWGPDFKRRRLGGTIAAIIRDRIGRPNDHYIPDDPFELVLWDEGFDSGMGEIEAEMQVGEIVGDEALVDYLWPSFRQMTFGEVVDALLYPSEEVLDRLRPWPHSGDQALEAQPCPALATFLDLREYLVKQVPGLPRRAVQPSARIKKLSPYAQSELSGYIVHRFRVNPLLERDHEWLGRFGAWVGASAITLAFFLCMAFKLGSQDGEYKTAVSVSLSLWLIPTAITALIVAPSVLFGFVSFLKARNECSVDTIGQLVRWILDARARV